MRWASGDPQGHTRVVWPGLRCTRSCKPRRHAAETRMRPPSPDFAAPGRGNHDDMQPSGGSSLLEKTGP
jgi:hypothetical protein